MESPNPQGIPNLKIQVPRKPDMEVLVPGMEQNAVRTCILGSQGISNPIHRHQCRSQTVMLIPANWRTSMP